VYTAVYIEHPEMSLTHDKISRTTVQNKYDIVHENRMGSKCTCKSIMTVSSTK